MPAGYDPALVERVRDAFARLQDKQAVADELGLSRPKVQRVLKAVEKEAAIHSLGQGTFRPIPGFGVTQVTSAINRDGDKVFDWVQQKPDAAEREAFLHAMITEMLEPLKGLAPFVPPPTRPLEHLLAVYPIGDHHYGMKADARETGDNYDCAIAANRLTAAVDHLANTVPPAREALLLNLGDFYHANDSKNVTPESGNLLDVDTRHGQVLESGAMTLIRCVLRLLERHETVHVWNMRGNHDPDAAFALSIAMKFYFHNEPRVIVDMGPSLYKYLRFGNNLIASHHGHGAKGDALPLLMAVDRPEDWAATEHRVWHCGHIHHKTLKEHPGVDVETHRTLAGSDAWHHGKGYRSKRDMSVILYDRELGEVQRNRFDMRMVEKMAEAA